MGSILEVEKLVKSYAGKEVLHGVTFQVEPGEIFALLGTNGAGKTTTLECIEGLKRYDKGMVSFHNQRAVAGAKLHAYIGIQLQSTALPGNITVIEAFRLFCLANKVKADKNLLNQFGLKELVHKQYSFLSTGQKRRLHLALALVHNPDIIFLDEPTAGLDVEGQAALHEEIFRLKALGKTILIASHDMAEVEKLCDRIAIIKEGRIGFIGRPEELIPSFTDTKEIALKTDNPCQSTEFTFSKFIKRNNGYDYFETETLSEALLELLKSYKEKDNHILDIKINHTTLEEKFLEFSREELV
ncbi:ABC transporter ATP-binding protein [Anaerocolumna sp. AGMB13025]|uniref:ABC transporter ATP-binding protein n=1 Tax=Anaerocolumna sp. AGMB13025 TaxID=3039116 RepID=UPI00241F369D|nr:ABC transporter ATP-binding protein [Anaerocolumna sp. AGMB13025]WFR55889.1 ABC transporter ATP-binding protein [Anaerocolumna sp. AGMB13025]